ncbi:MAG: VWA domain-containing protein [Saprospiraceae bacterium]|nr:VWA domain-containing protein [Saprospiraceae bacterium]HMW38179.1 VWA domain-containing protein [Saprospiraceae bacterium]HMX87690.1 VWA domain-containing protein [Saprospiraceae bacterium]HMZ39505.1 VWA domain-containing protein [Saprospiraceae bacterium]HNA63122.1 VWA domain-containing protein [Saprospiraceae bacterium]
MFGNVIEEIVLSRWKLILGQSADPTEEIQLTGEEERIEKLLQTAYGDRQTGGFGKSSAKVRKWLEGIREHFSPEVVSLMQKDVLERQNASEMLLEAELIEKIEPDIQLVAIIISLQELLPDTTRKVAKDLVARLVRKIEEKLRTRIQHAVRRGLSPRSHEVNPAGSLIDWKKTIIRNIKSYQPETAQIIPERWFGFYKGYMLKELFLVIDKSESMISSAIHASVIGAILASLKSIRTHIIFFDTEIQDVTDKYRDPVDILFSVPMGGGTDIGRALNYTYQQMRYPKRSLVFLISDLDEYAPLDDLESAINRITSSGCNLEALLTLNEDGKTEFNHKVATMFQTRGVRPYSCTADKFPDILCERLMKL